MKIFKRTKGFVVATGKSVFTLEMVNPFGKRAGRPTRLVEGILDTWESVRDTFLMLLGVLVGLLDILSKVIGIFMGFLPIEIGIFKQTMAMEEIEKLVERLNKNA